jgi:hypothetical protein
MLNQYAKKLPRHRIRFLPTTVYTTTKKHHNQKEKTLADFKSHNSADQLISINIPYISLIDIVKRLLHDKENQ